MQAILLLSLHPAASARLTDALGDLFDLRPASSVRHARERLAAEPRLRVVVLALGSAPSVLVRSLVRATHRQVDRPLIVVTDGRGGPSAAELFAAGADECLVDDMPAPEVRARVTATVRRGQWSELTAVTPERVAARASTLVVGNLVVRTDVRRVTLDSRVLRPSPREYALLLHLARRGGEVVSRQSLLNQVWGGRQWSPQLVNAYVARLRRRLGETAEHPRYLHVIHGVGIKLAAPGPEHPRAATFPPERGTVIPFSPRAGRQSTPTGAQWSGSFFS
ncbi:winged helix-turn-helix domain-containing protein [Actinosynnema sp. CA-299493]